MDRRDFLAGAAALALAPRELLAAAPPRRIALATADLEAHVVAVDLATGAVVERIHTHAYPRSIETVGACAVVCHSELGIVSVLDARSLHVVHALRGFDEPRYTAAHPDGRHAYVTDAERGEVVLLDVLAGRVLARERVGHLARHIAIDRAARHLWIALGSKAREITLVALDGTRPHAKHTFSPRHAATTSASHPTAGMPGSARARAGSSPSTTCRPVASSRALRPAGRRST